MRRLLPVLFALALATACSTSQAPTPAATPTSLKPALLLTPRPTLPPTATPALSVTPENAENATPRPTTAPRPSPTQSFHGTPVTASEPLQGTLLDDQLLSPIIGAGFPYRVYLPPDYVQETHKRYPVLYMLHGAGGNYTEWSDSFLPEQADRMMSAGDIPPMIIVMPDDGGQTYWANWSEGGPRWGDYLSQDVVATIDDRYRTINDRASRAIGGLSMGGLGALNMGLLHPDEFGVVGAHSPSVRLEPDPSLWFLAGQTFWDNNPVWLVQHRTGLDGLQVWMDAGTEDVWLPNIEVVHTALVDQGVDITYHEFPGPHEAEYWIEHVPDYLRFYAAALRD